MSKSRFGIGEWYGHSFVHIAPEDRVRVAKSLLLPKRDQPGRPCPFLVGTKCNKAGGVCTIRLYDQVTSDGSAVVHEGEGGELRTVCPNRFWEDTTIFRHVGGSILDDPDPINVKEVGFLKRVVDDARKGGRDEVGRIDSILVHSDTSDLNWCALEIQAVYFSGSKMGLEYEAIGRMTSEELPFPVAHRRPDYRSSGPKRLLPQLQTKVPSLRRWGKKMAVVVDTSFFNSLGAMDDVGDISSCDIAWFVMKYEVTRGRHFLRPDFVRYTTLEKAVEGLTGGVPVTLAEFEGRIRRKLSR